MFSRRSILETAPGADRSRRSPRKTGLPRGASRRECRFSGGPMHVWDAGQYLRFADERTRPALDLIARIDLAAPQRIVDLGCGPGNSTALLRQRWPEAAIAGLDSSADMLESARRDYPGIDFAIGDIAEWAAAEPHDLVFSNAALQWVGRHEHLLPRLMDMVAPDGALAVQRPRNHDFATQALMRQAALEVPW